MSEVTVRNYAVLDTNGLVTGYVSKPENEALETDIEVPGMDLTPGKYRWDFTKQTFQYVGRVELKPDEPLPPMIVAEALAQGMRALFAANPDVKIPLATAQWFDWLDRQQLIQQMRGMRPS